MNFSVAIRWLSGRAWSRAGAIAVTMSRGTPRRALVLSTRVMLLLGGSAAIACAVTLMLWNSFGPGPLDVFVTGLSAATGLPLALGYWSASAAMMLTVVLLGRRPGFGTIVTPLILGPTVQLLLTTIDGVPAPTSVVTQAAVHMVAIGVAGLGAGALIASGLGAGTGELLAAAASDRSGRPAPQIRLGVEVCWLATGVLLGGTIGVGTLLVAALIGPAVAIGYRVVDRSLVASRRRIGTALATRSYAPSV